MDKQPAPAESERRQATVLFADLTGFTALSERLDPEDMTALVDRCLATLAAVVDEHGGHVDKYIGDCVMALFGVPTALESAPKSAINAAIEMRHRMVQFNAEHRVVPPLELHIGINTGLVIAGHVGGEARREFTAMGDAVNLASRLKDVARAGAICVGPETYRYTKEEFEYRPLPARKIKGKAATVQAYELLSVTERVHRWRPLPAQRMVFSELVGRGAEVARLQASVGDTIAGRGGVVSVIGEAGIGKSRLVAEAMGGEAVARATFLEGRSLSMGQGLSFHPFVDLLRSWAHVADEDDERAALGKLEAAIARLFPDGAADVFPFVATLMGMRVSGRHAARLEGIKGEAMEKLIFKSVRDLLLRMAAAQPLVLVFEDLHWADRSSAQLLESLLALALEHRILFVNVFRPDPDTAHPILRHARTRCAARHSEIVLERLDDQACAQLIENLLKTDYFPRTMSAMIGAKGEGNPFFIEEMVRSLIEQGVVVEGADGRLRVTETVSSVVVPGTIQEVIMARVDRLDDAARRVLQVASVMGRSFLHRVVAAVMGDAVDLEAQLATLEERQLVMEAGAGRTAHAARGAAGAERECRFKHALVQETVYESLLNRTRKELHLTIAETIEVLFADRLSDFYGMLAYHFSRAESLHKAEEYLLKAGEEAVRSAASSEALSYFREALRIYLVIHGDGGDPRRRALLAKNIAQALLNTGALVESIEHFDQALGFLGDPTPHGKLGLTLTFARDVASVLSRLYLPAPTWTRPSRRPPEPDVLALRFERARAETTSDPARFFVDMIGTIRRLNMVDARQSEAACGIYAAGASFAWAGISFSVSRRFLSVAREHVRPDHFLDYWIYRSIKFIYDYVAGNWDEALVPDDALVDEALRYGQLWDVSTFLGLNCERKLRQGDFAAATALIARIAGVITTYGYEFARSTQWANTAFLLLEQRKLAEARDALDTYYHIRHEEALNLLALGTRAKVLLLLGDHSGADAALAQAERLLGELGRVAPYHVGAYHTSRFLADVSRLEAAAPASGQRQRLALRRAARASMRAALRTARRLARERPEAFKLAGHYWWACGKPARALAWWARSLTHGERLGTLPEMARTYMEAGQRLGAGGEGLRLGGLDAAGCLDKARTLFARLGLEWDLQRLAAETPRATAP